MGGEAQDDGPIPDRLVISVRTVDNHLQHGFDKLGIRSRRELGRLLGRNGQAKTTAE
jgi:DNA-binding NarL/FixJ family response regulator